MIFVIYKNFSLIFVISMSCYFKLSHSGNSENIFFVLDIRSGNNVLEIVFSGFKVLEIVFSGFKVLEIIFWI